MFYGCFLDQHQVFGHTYNNKVVIVSRHKQNIVCFLLSSLKTSGYVGWEIMLICQTFLSILIKMFQFHKIILFLETVNVCFHPIL